MLTFDMDQWLTKLELDVKFSALDHLTSMRFMNGEPSHFMRSINENSKHKQISSTPTKYFKMTCDMRIKNPVYLGTLSTATQKIK